MPLAEASGPGSGDPQLQRPCDRGLRFGPKQGTPSSLDCQLRPCPAPIAGSTPTSCYHWPGRQRILSQAVRLQGPHSSTQIILHGIQYITFQAPKHFEIQHGKGRKKE
ncbi:hypothetical protein MDA_GLEAN10019617 [Myotis davidii]|uniref:Uncharacterized protein n=1 Tax=Myotis davidii TaxID=225400 RepID=L5LV63_MYODS|nr:hypothetical protein MDA_GLEAN10019617 [Myotis davidii]